MSLILNFRMTYPILYLWLLQKFMSTILGVRFSSKYCRFAQSLITFSCQVGSLAVPSHSKPSPPKTVGFVDKLRARVANRDKRSRIRAVNTNTTKASSEHDAVPLSFSTQPSLRQSDSAEDQTMG
jgi:hypothetical protein